MATERDHNIQSRWGMAYSFVWGIASEINRQFVWFCVQKQGWQQVVNEGKHSPRHNRQCGKWAKLHLGSEDESVFVQTFNVRRVGVGSDYLYSTVIYHKSHSLTVTIPNKVYVYNKVNVSGTLNLVIYCS